MAQPNGRRTTAPVTRAISVFSANSDEPTQTGTPPPAPQTKVPAHYKLPPTVPSPFAGTLDASLDAILEFAALHPQLRPATTTLLKDPERTTNWGEVLSTVLANPLNGRELLEEFLFLVTRTLIPEQIAQNRALLFRLHSVKRQLSVKIVLRYDMLREWTKRDSNQLIVMESKPPAKVPVPPPAPLQNLQYPNRRPLMLNMLPTLVQAPAEGYATKKLSDAMRHHATELDHHMLLTDEVVASWGTIRVLTAAAGAALQWQWLRENTETLAEMEVHGWEDLDMRADECEWVRDANKEKEGGKAK
ncbi:hypothetical protein BU26DRAFT_523367 [Trematosphaeria pertusa]|uniref:Uncharacterized protein n=1 Tax=Trematosphaeria pertusa TaxID=390896 RepID=A0A6A6I1D6_9PLEO|nr:uncharacterized protein BU26DRAFT_523367 [Trematosphaeria pertusa]KAF2243782.1 hypothetical protein BU26DRAFT_523367 [Trematosphaeria pertusa]